MLDDHCQPHSLIQAPVLFTSVDTQVRNMMKHFVTQREGNERARVVRTVESMARAEILAQDRSLGTFEAFDNNGAQIVEVASVLPAPR